ncbi:MAG: sigma-70 family RNA polymerase sigma factor [Firmicutes bacterium]|nr:sigma-70 family RNA polymerase sigma factor [Bacillota bacterium]
MEDLELCGKITRSIIKKLTSEYFFDFDKDDLYQRGMLEFIEASKRYDEKKNAKFTTFAYKSVENGIKDEMKFQMNIAGVDFVKPSKSVSLDEDNGLIDTLAAEPEAEDNTDEIRRMVSLKMEILTETEQKVLCCFFGIDCERQIGLKKIAKQLAMSEIEVRLAMESGRRKLGIEQYKAVTLIDIIAKISDEHHPVTKDDIMNAFKESGSAISDNPVTLSNAVDELLSVVDPLEHTDDNDIDYRIKYKGYENDLIAQKALKDKKHKAPSITDLYYVHTFTDSEMDKLIQCVCFSDMIGSADKENLVKKIVNTASMYYETPFYDRLHKKMCFNPKGIFSRTAHLPENGEETNIIGENIAAIQSAINESKQIGFSFGGYNADKKLCRIDRAYTLSPYYIVVYHDMYYLIGNKPKTDTLSHYRIDLMSDITILSDEREPLSRFEELKATTNAWDPVEYMSEHLYMGYDKPRTILLKIPNDKYTVLHDWFGDNYTVLEQGKDGVDKVSVFTSPSMIVPWALQYADIVDVLDEDIRKEIKEKISGLEKKYGRK